MEEEFYELKSEIRGLKKQNKQFAAYLQRQKPTKRKFASTQIKKVQMTEVNKVIEEDEEIERFSPQATDQIDNTFQRKLDTQIEKPNSSDTFNMGVSMGAQLLQMMASNIGNNENSQKELKEKKKIRNFNFRCNLDAIDKIIEEENEVQEQVVVKTKKETSITRK